MPNFEEYMESKIPDYKTKLEIQQIMYLQQLFITYRDAISEENFNSLEPRISNKQNLSLKINLAQKALDNAINGFISGKKEENISQFKR